jgi:FkbM family methyltransferase
MGGYKMRAVVLIAVLLLVLMLISKPGAEMRQFVYPNGQLVYVTPETTVRNQHTWPPDGRAGESSSIEYVYRKLEEAVRARGSARLLDVGAQGGLYALYARHFAGVAVDAYEPFPESHARLVDNIALNGVGGKVRAFAFALSDTDSTRTMRVSPEHPGLNTLGASPLRFSGGGEVQVETRTIDGIYAATRVDVIKVDTEGWEYFVLLGGRAVLLRDRPELLLEVNDVNMQQCGLTREKLFALLAELGYRYVATIDGENVAFSAR